MASKLALQICQRHLETTVTVAAARLAANADAELHEVRDVLNDLKRHLFETNASGRGTPTTKRLEQRVRALWLELQVN